MFQIISSTKKNVLVCYTERVKNQCSLELIWLGCVRCFNLLITGLLMFYSGFLIEILESVFSLILKDYEMIQFYLVKILTLVLSIFALACFSLILKAFGLIPYTPMYSLQVQQIFMRENKCNCGLFSFQTTRQTPYNHKMLVDIYFHYQFLWMRKPNPQPAPRINKFLQAENCQWLFAPLRAVCSFLKFYLALIVP